MIGRLAARAIGGTLRPASRGQPPAPPPGPPKDDGAGLIVFLLMLPWWIATLASARSGHVSAFLLNASWIGFVILLPVAALVLRTTAVRRARARRRAVRRKYRPVPDTRAADGRARAADIAERERRVACLLSVPCPHPPYGCAAAIGSGCFPVGLPFTVLNRDDMTACHLERLRAAVTSGHADRADVTAQFGEELPRGLRTL